MGISFTWTMLDSPRIIRQLIFIIGTGSVAPRVFELVCHMSRLEIRDLLVFDLCSRHVIVLPSIFSDMIIGNPTFCFRPFNLEFLDLFNVTYQL